jgi:hypothetical protein
MLIIADFNVSYNYNIYHLIYIGHYLIDSFIITITARF